MKKPKAKQRVTVRFTVEQVDALKSVAVDSADGDVSRVVRFFLFGSDTGSVLKGLSNAVEK